MAKKKDKDPNIHNIAYKYALDYKQEQSVYDYLFMSFGCRRKVYNYYVDCLYQQLEAENSNWRQLEAPLLKWGGFTYFGIQTRRAPTSR